MRHIRVLVCQVDDGTPDLMTELACCDLATPTVATLQPETALDTLEATCASRLAHPCLVSSSEGACGADHLCDL